MVFLFESSALRYTGKSWTDVSIRIIDLHPDGNDQGPYLHLYKSKKDVKKPILSIELLQVAAWTRFGYAAIMPADTKEHRRDNRVQAECLLAIPSNDEPVVATKSRSFSNLTMVGHKAPKCWQTLITLAFDTPGQLYECMCAMAKAVHQIDPPVIPITVPVTEPPTRRYIDCAYHPVLMAIEPKNQWEKYWLYALPVSSSFEVKMMPKMTRGAGAKSAKAKKHNERSVDAQENTEASSDSEDPIAGHRHFYTDSIEVDVLDYSEVVSAEPVYAHHQYGPARSPVGQQSVASRHSTHVPIPVVVEPSFTHQLDNTEMETIEPHYSQHVDRAPPPCEPIRAAPRSTVSIDLYQRHLTYSEVPACEPVYIEARDDTAPSYYKSAYFEAETPTDDGSRLTYTEVPQTDHIYYQSDNMVETNSAKPVRPKKMTPPIPMEQSQTYVTTLILPQRLNNTEVVPEEICQSVHRKYSPPPVATIEHQNRSLILDEKMANVEQSYFPPPPPEVYEQVKTLNYTEAVGGQLIVDDNHVEPNKAKRVNSTAYSGASLQEKKVGDENVEIYTPIYTCTLDNTELISVITTSSPEDAHEDRFWTSKDSVCSDDSAVASFSWDVPETPVNERVRKNRLPPPVSPKPRIDVRWSSIVREEINNYDVNACD